MSAPPHDPAEKGAVSVLLVDCPDQRGLIHAITGWLQQHDANILANHEFVDRETSRFFMRTEFVGVTPSALTLGNLQGLLPAPAVIRLADSGPRRVVILATREPHCLGDLLLRHAIGAFGAEIMAVASNHVTLAPLARRFDVPFHHVPHGDRSREQHEQALMQVLERYTFDYLVLAKYMRILSPSFIARHRDRVVNIHHSFLPAFMGSNPYRQAFERGVKMIGASAHFVTEALDEGPIITQSVMPIDHGFRPDELVRAGREVEKTVLAKALKLVFEDRVFVHKNRTIVFE